MSEEKKHKDAEKTDKSHVRDLPSHKEVKGGGGNFKPVSPGTGGNKIQPVPTQQGS